MHHKKNSSICSFLSSINPSDFRLFFSFIIKIDYHCISFNPPPKKNIHDHTLLKADIRSSLFVYPILPKNDVTYISFLKRQLFWMI